MARIFNNLPERQAKVNSLLAAQEKAEAAKVTKKIGNQGCQNAILTNDIISCLNHFPVLKRKERYRDKSQCKNEQVIFITLAHAGVLLLFIGLLALVRLKS